MRSKVAMVSEVLGRCRLTGRARLRVAEATLPRAACPASSRALRASSAASSRLAAGRCWLREGRGWHWIRVHDGGCRAARWIGRRSGGKLARRFPMADLGQRAHHRARMHTRTRTRTRTRTQTLSDSRWLISGSAISAARTPPRALAHSRTHTHACTHARTHQRPTISFRHKHTRIWTRTKTPLY